jgi:hypothetical protein
VVIETDLGKDPRSRLGSQSSEMLMLRGRKVVFYSAPNLPAASVI